MNQLILYTLVLVAEGTPFQFYQDCVHDFLDEGREDQHFVLLQRTARRSQGVQADDYEFALNLTNAVLENRLDPQKGPVDDILDKITKIAKKITEGATNITSILDRLRKYADPVPLGGHSTAQNNAAVLSVLCFVAVPTFLAFLGEAAFKPRVISNGRPPIWVFTMLLLSYLLLIPGLTQVLFSFLVQVQVLGLRLTVTAPHGKRGAMTESMFSAAQELWISGSKVGGCLVILYAIALPALKLLLLTMGELWRYSSSQTRVLIAWYCIRIVQVLSKWACPDMFAYILLMYLLRSLGQRSALIESPIQLDYGFTCFSVFCISSTLSSLAMRLPAVEVEHGPTKETDAPVSIRLFGRIGLSWVIGLLTSCFIALFVAGLNFPCMALHLKPQFLVQPHGPLPSVAMPFLKALKLEEQVNADVSMWQAIRALRGWSSNGEATAVIAYVMYFVFAVVFTLVDVVLLNAVAVMLGNTDKDLGQNDKSTLNLGNMMSAVKFAKHTSMMDVAVMGVFVICMAGSSYKSEGIVFMLKPGLLLLALAEVFHMAIYHLVSTAAVHVEGMAGKTDSQAAIQKA